MDNAPAIQTRLQLKETYTFNAGFTLYMLPYGIYYPEGQDGGGIYYRAPIPIVRRGFFGADSFVHGGIYVPTDVTWSLGFVWLYVRDDDGSIRGKTMPSGFVMTYGDRWYRETYTGMPPPPVEELQADVSFGADGKPEGLYELHSSTGKVHVKGTFEHGRKVGIWIFWDSGGVKVAEMTYRDGLKDGPCRMWYGSFAFPESAGKDKLAVTLEADRMHGEKTRWKKDGAVECTTLFEHGEIVEAHCWDDDGAEMSQSEARKTARDELMSDERWLKDMDSEIERSLRDKPAGGAER